MKRIRSYVRRLYWRLATPRRGRMVSRDRKFVIDFADRVIRIEV
ncbi:hypothetical protein [Rhodoligotrophos ferricapiens]